MPWGVDVPRALLIKVPHNFCIALQAAEFQLIYRSSQEPSGPRYPAFLHYLFLQILLATVLFAPQIARSELTVAQLKAEPGLTPEAFMRHFADFKFELGREVRTPEIFLKNRSGDCDDFATLAASILREKGYTTRLVVIYMGGATHVVCYVKETKSYLDYNCRKKVSPLVKCDWDLAAIGESVAQSFRSQWRSASEFTFNNGTREFASTVFR